MSIPRLTGGVLLLASVFAVARAPADRLAFPAAGFAIAALDSAPSKESTQILLMSLPPSAGFAPNVNVQIQPCAEGVQAYLALSKKQFEQMGLELVAESKPSASAITMEYQGELQGRKLHCYARAVQKGGSIYLATGTALQSQWDKVGAELKACVDSLETLKDAPAGAGGKATGGK
ncbi:MAG: hypothetical protein IT458_20150 [Planctomycetes bacterium]|nr:hypothetical protein [Planctomycetota bacterium]